MVWPAAATAAVGTQTGIGLGNFGLGVYDRFSGTDTGMQGDAALWMDDFNWKSSLRNEDFQHQLAEHGIKMRVDDAVSAGLHPLVGAGINPASGGWGGAAFSGTQPPEQRRFHDPGFGQDISRAISATASPQEKALTAAQIAQAEAATAESNFKTQLYKRQLADLTATPALPNKYQQFATPLGIENAYSDAYARAIGSDPLGMWAGSIQKGLFGPDSVYNQTVMGLHRSRDNAYRYSKIHGGGHP